MSGDCVSLDNDKLLTAAELAKILGIDRTTLRSYVRVGIVPSVKIGPRIRRFRRSEVENWLRKNSQGAR